MLYLITGTPGSGKSLFAVSKILEYVEENKKLLEQGKEPRMIYADIEGLNISGVEPAPDDWRDTPDGSVIFYDEVQQRKEFKKSKFDNSICDDLQIHRHTGHDIYGITQFPVLLHPNFRAVVGMHYHLHRGWGLSSATVFTWAYCVDAPNAPSNKKIAEGSFRFNYPKECYDYYTSATQHTHKARVPKKFFLIIFAILFFGYLAYKQIFVKDNYLKGIYGKNSNTTQNTKTANGEQSDTSNLPKAQVPSPNDIKAQEIQSRRIYLRQNNLPQDYEIRRTDPYLQVRGVIHFKDKCTAVNAIGDTMTLSYDECLSYVDTGRVYKSDYSTTGNYEQTYIPDTTTYPTEHKTITDTPTPKIETTNPM